MITDKIDKSPDWPSSKVILLSFSSLAFSLLIIPRLFTIYDRKQIKKDSVVSEARIIRIEKVVRRSGTRFRAEAQYWVDGKPFTSTGRIIHKLTDKQRNLLLDRTLPVIYERHNPSNSVLLSNEERFEKFEFRLPDSLRWTRQYFY